MVIVLDVGKLVNSAAVEICVTWEDEVFGDVGMDIDGLGLHVVVGRIDGDEQTESEVESAVFTGFVDEADEMYNIRDYWSFF